MNKLALVSLSATGTFEAIKDFCVSTKDFFVTAGKILWYLTHPKNLGLFLWGGCVKYSLPICIMICFFSLALYLCGWKKIKPLIGGSFLGYLVIQMVNSAL